jgi:hypothetical protein
VWKAQQPDLTFNPRNEAKNVAGYFRGDSDATLMVAVATYPDSESWGERPSTDRVGEQLAPACRALTHP